MKLKHKDSLNAHKHTISWVLDFKSNSHDCLQTIQEGSTKYEGGKWCWLPGLLKAPTAEPQTHIPSHQNLRRHGWSQEHRALGRKVNKVV